MTQREKLIELIDKSDVPLCDECGTIPADIRIERLADFLLANGVVVPPCKPGDTVYAILFGLGDDPILKIGVEYVIMQSSLQGLNISVYFSDPQQPMCNHHGIVGKDVFLTHKEAEVGLKKLEEENEKWRKMLKK